MIGSEGMVGAQLALGISTAPLHGLVLGAGPAWRVKAADLRRLLTKSEELRGTLERYLYLRFHEIGPRLAKWLLMSQDRAHSDQFRVTQEFLAYMLGVRRVGITNAASALQQQELISYHRGDVTVVDRAGLEAAACGCYADDKVAYSAVMR
ncbi:MAG: helix-turn-helix domain-containing protein [Granulicella sp.]